MTIFLDIQPKRSLHEVGGLENCQKMGISVCVTYSDILDQCSIFMPDDSCLEQFQNSMPDVYLNDHFSSDMDELLSILEKDNVVGFNIKAFEYNLLRSYIGNMSHIFSSTIDMVDHIYNLLGFNVSAENIIGCTLGLSKSQKEEHVLHECKDCNIEKIISHCKNNVQLTHGVYTHGVENGFIKYFDARSNKVLDIEVDW
ncbi:MAG: hypothetical protein M8350_02665 [Methanosarcinaceae archaeon]|nr:hypothetical protein [Methanosarcinaceae archaeon]